MLLITCFCLFLMLQLLPTNGNLHHRKDLAILLDSSRSIKDYAYKSSLAFMRQYINYMSISPGTTRIALITFTSKAKLEFGFEKYVNRECLQKKLASLRKRRRKGRMNIDVGLQKAIDLFMNNNGFAKDRELYIFSDGKWNEGGNPKKSLSKLRKLGVKMKVFAIGRSPNKIKLQYIAGTLCKTCYVKLSANYKKQNRLIKVLTKRKEAATACKGRGIVLDECNRECSCVNGRMVDCFRVRREFTTLSKNEKKRYLQAYYKITTEEPLKSRFVKFIKIHNKYFNKGIHKRYQFLPWHRWYVYEFENLMREVDCKITVPYWDWSYWSFDAWKVGLHIWRDDEYGFGGNGVKSNEYCVQTGPFNSSSWAHPAPENTREILMTVDEILGHCPAIIKINSSKPLKKCLRRSFSEVPSNLAHVLQTIAIPCNKFLDFEKTVRKGYHNQIHNEIGGEMCTDFAANAPEFFLHHTFLDFIWIRWQENGPTCKSAYFERPVKLIESPYMTIDFVDSYSQGECVKVRYDDFLQRALKPGDYIGTPKKATIVIDPNCASDEPTSFARPRPAFFQLEDED